MQYLSTIMQMILIVLWFVNPDFASVPWYVIFLPTLIPLTIIGTICVGFLLVFLAACVKAIWRR